MTSSNLSGCLQQISQARFARYSHDQDQLHHLCKATPPLQERRLLLGVDLLRRLLRRPCRSTGQLEPGRKPALRIKLTMFSANVWMSCSFCGTQLGCPLLISAYLSALRASAASRSSRERDSSFASTAPVLTTTEVPRSAVKSRCDRSACST